MEVGEDRSPVRRDTWSRRRVIPIVDVEALVERLVEQPASFRARVPVEGIRVGDEIDRLPQHIHPECQLLRRVDESGLDPLALVFELEQFRPDLVLRNGPVGDQVDQPAFLACQLFQLPVQIAVHLPHIGLLVIEDPGQQRPGLGDEIGRQLQRTVVLDDRVLDHLHRQARQVAQLGLGTAADEIGVAGAVAAGGLAVDQPGGLPVVAAPCAEQATLEIVVVNSVTTPVRAAMPKNLLHTLEQIVTDQRFVTPRVGLSLPLDIPDVVRIAEHGVQSPRRHRPSDRMATTGPAGETEIGHRRLEILDRVIPGGVQLPRPHDQRAAFRVDPDRVHLATLDVHSGVDVSDLRPATRATVHGLVQHLGADVLTGQPVLGVVKDIGDRRHHVGIDALTEVLFRRNQLHAHEIELPLGDRSIDVVTERTRPHIDDHIPDLRMLTEIVQHLLECRALLDRLTGHAGFDELLHDIRRQRVGALLDGLALRRNRVAVRIDVDSRIQLLLVRNTQVCNCGLGKSTTFHGASSRVDDSFASAMTARLSLRRSRGSRVSLSTVT
nr:hypothetical protein [Nocardia aurantia]